MARRKNIKQGDKFGMLTVIKEVAPNITPCGTKQRKFLCKCECGNETITTLANFRNKYADCGCTKRSIKGKTKIYKGKLIKLFLYTTYQGMIRRCYDKKLKSYRNYGARGIRVCEEWKCNFFAFYYWSIANGASEDLTIDRIDNDGNYEPTNCRWVTNQVQSNNKRTNRIIEYNGELHNVTEWATILGCKESLIRHRLDRDKRTIGQALGFEPIEYKCVIKYISYKGQTLNITQWSKKLGIARDTIRQRLQNGLPLEEVFKFTRKRRKTL